jgi:hypothetical protein
MARKSMRPNQFKPINESCIGITKRGSNGANEYVVFRRNAYYSPHKHSGLTTHLILSGELTVSYPDDAQPTKETFGVGGRLDVDAGRKHEVWVGPEGCTYVIGE